MLAVLSILSLFFALALAVFLLVLAFAFSAESYHERRHRSRRCGRRGRRPTRDAESPLTGAEPWPRGIRPAEEKFGKILPEAEAITRRAGIASISALGRCATYSEAL